MGVSMRFSFWSAAVALTLALGACGGDEEKDDDKDAGATVMDGAVGGGADAGRIDAALSLPIADLDDNVAGATCTVDSDCKGTNASCDGTTCTGVCENNGNCGAGGSCVQPLPGVPGLCSRVCRENTDCKSGLECRAGLDFGEILEAVEDAGLGIDGGVDVRNVPKTCGPSLGTVDLADGVVGIACTANAQCGPGECATTINFLEPTPSGYCTGKCVVDIECGAGGICYKDPASAFFGVDGRCLLGCSSSATCRSGQVCRVSRFIDSKSYCLPPVPDAGAGTVSGDAGASDAGASDAAAATNDL